MKEIERGFNVWNSELKLFDKVSLTENQDECNVKIRFSDRSTDNLFLFDSVGGNLAYR